MTPYEVLGVSPNSTPDEIKAAYRDLAKKYHPDVCSDEGAEDRLKEINAAYDQIKNGAKSSFGHPFGNAQSAYDDFVAFARAQAAKAQADVRAIVELSLEDAFKGRRVKIGAHEIDIPAGVNGNATFVVPRAGRVVDGVQGDLLVGIRVRPHEIFERHFNDLYLSIEIDVFDAMKGCEVEVKGLDGNIVTLKVPAGCQHGENVAAPDCGMTIPYSEGRGYMVGVVKIIIPKMTPDQVDKMKSVLK